MSTLLSLWYGLAIDKIKATCKALNLQWQQNLAVNTTLTFKHGTVLLFHTLYLEDLEKHD